MPKDQGPVRQTQVIMFIDNTNIKTLHQLHHRNEVKKITKNDNQKTLKHIIFNSPTWEN